MGKKNNKKNGSVNKAENKSQNESAGQTGNKSILQVDVSSDSATPPPAGAGAAAAASTPVTPSVVSSCGLCRLPDTEDMVECDKCEKWFHYECVGVGDSVADRDFSCEECRIAAILKPTSKVNTEQKSQPVRTEENSKLANEVEQLRRRLDEQLKAFEEIMQKKDEEIKRTVTRQRELFDEQLQAVQQQQQQQLQAVQQQQKQQLQAVQQQQKQQSEAIQQQQKQRLDPKAVDFVPQTSRSDFGGGKSVTGAFPKASSTVIGGTKSTSGTAASSLEQQRKLLEEKHALERRHLEERIALQQSSERREEEQAPAAAGNDSTIRGWSEADLLEFLAQNSTNELSRSQLAARQAVARELPPFYGNPEEWPLFIASFESSTRLCGYSDEENLLRLQRSLKGKALESVRCRLLHPSNLAGVIVTLRTLFGRPEIIIHSLVTKIKEMPAPKTEKLNSLIEFGVAVQNMCATIKACGLDDYMCNVALLQELVERLPPTIKLNWAIHRQTLNRVTMVDFGDWLGKLVEAACAVTIPTIGSTTKSEKRGRKDDNFLNVHSDSTPNEPQPREANGKSVPSKSPKECVICGGGCSTADACEQFQEMDVDSRWSEVRAHKLCRKCLQKHFGPCQAKGPCGKNGCTYMHNKLLHDESRYKKPEAAASEGSTGAAVSQNCNTHLATPATVLFRYVPVTIHGRGVTVNTYAFLDDGSSATFIEHGLLEELNLEGESHPLCLNWTGGQQRDENESVKLSLKISGVHNQAKRYVLPKVHTVRNLSLPRQSVSMAELAEQYKHLEGLPVDSFASVSPRILIGVDNVHLGYPVKSHEGGEDQPIAAKTRLGWIVYGPCTMTGGTEIKDYTAYHSFHICACDRVADNELNSTLKDYFSLDSLGIYKSSKPLLAKDDERALEQLSLKTNLKGDRYETGLLWRFNDAQLPDSRAMAQKRLLCLEKRMSRDENLAETLRTKLKEYEEKGYIRKLTAPELVIPHTRTWYLPIFPVINPNKPGKVRIVWDAAATVRGVSLNSFLLTGPDQLSSLLSVLYKFREFRFAVTGDIREMYHQVLVNSEDQHSQRFLWRDGDSSKDPEVYVMRVMTFGATCSPSSAQFVKNLNAARFEEQFPRAAECIVDEHYVDDMLTSTESEEEAAKLAQDVRYIHSQGGFEIRNWLSNSSKVLKALRGDEAVEKSMDLCSEMAKEKVLGMWWCTRTDTFTFKLSARHDQDLLSGRKPPTKREALRTLMMVYDPLGLIANFLSYLKVLLQEIWRSGVDWDEVIPENLQEKWKLWLQVLPEVETVRVPRCYRSVTTPDNNNNIQLHVFVDASENGIAAVAYWRFEQTGTVECALAGAKTRVAPLKSVSIPRLELQAAVVGARLANTIVEAHKLKPTEQFFWTDSRDVVCWIKSDHRRYNQFVACRVGEILETTEASSWSWVSTKQNVADEGTKWQRLPDFSPSSRWFRGPEFLWQSKEEWPLNTADLGKTTEELRPNVLHHVIVLSCQPLIQWERFRTWKILLRTAAYVMRFVGICESRAKRQTAPTGPLTQEEYRRAENFIYRQLQRQSFPEEVRILSSSDQQGRKVAVRLSKSSPLYQLSPVLDEVGVLRMRGRIDACQFVPEDTKRPVLLPKRNIVTDLIIWRYHQRYGHRNHETVLNELRQKYHIPRLRSEFNRVRYECQTCKLLRAEPQPPEMGSLPPARLAAFTRPFSYTGIDYFGPLQVVVGRKVEKRYGVLLTCMTIRAVHIEIAHSLTTDSCIMALRNFVVRRGQPTEIISDRGTNFIGAERELREELQNVNQDRMVEYFVDEDTKWTFNPPAAPHFGGCWERLVQSVKKILYQVQPQRMPNDEVLRNMLMEIELIINSRPLTHVPIESNSDYPLTPNHFLLGSSNGGKPPIAFDDNPVQLKNCWKKSQVVADEFWRKWIAEYLPTLTRRTRWFQPAKPIEVGDVVLVVDNKLPRNCWPKGRVIDAVPAKDGQVRRVTVQTAHGILERPAVKVAVLDVGSISSTSDQSKDQGSSVLGGSVTNAVTNRRTGNTSTAS